MKELDQFLHGQLAGVRTGNSFDGGLLHRLPLENAFGRHWFLSADGAGPRRFRPISCGSRGGRTRAPRPRWFTTTSWTKRKFGAIGAPRRREYGATAAVLLGDALFAHALNLATQFPTTEICSAVSESNASGLRRRNHADAAPRLGRTSRAPITSGSSTSRPPNYFAYRASSGATRRVSRPDIVEAVADSPGTSESRTQIYDDLATFLVRRNALEKPSAGSRQRKTHRCRCCS